MKTLNKVIFPRKSYNETTPKKSFKPSPSGVKTFGINTNADYVATEINLKVMPATYIYKEDGKEHEIKINMPGQHNIMNSLAALAVSRELDVPIKIIQKALINFPGIKRRFEIIGNFKIDKNSFLPINECFC